MSLKRSFTFYPYAPLRFVAYFFVFGSFLLVFCMQFISGVLWKIFVVIIVVLSLSLAKEFYARAPSSVTVSSHGICLKNTKHPNDIVDQSWNDFRFVYCLYGSKGHLYIMLAPEWLDEETQLRLWKQFQALRNGRPQLTISRCICIRVDGYWNKIMPYLSDNITIISDCLHVG